MPVECVCQRSECGKTFFVTPSRFANGWGKYCSKACMDFRPVIEVFCHNPACGKSFIPAPQNLAQGRGLYCCHPCSVAMTRIPIQNRFWTKVHKCIHDEYCPFCCWEWQAARNKAGYGVIMGEQDGKKRAQLANRVSWELINGRSLNAIFICHHCDNPPCVNPWHLYQGTARQNLHDMLRRNRQRQRQSFTPEDIAHIWELHRQGKTGREIANILGRSSKDTINKILRYESWAFISHGLISIRS